MLPYIVLVGSSIGLFGMLYYAKDTLLGGTRPNMVSWSMWCIADLIGTAASLAAGVTWAALPTFVAGFGPLIVIMASVANKRARWKLERLDYLCGSLSVLALVLWVVTSIPSVAIAFAIATDAFASMPTIIKGLRHPETESSSAYFGGVVSALSAFTVITVWTFPEYAFPAYLVAINIVLMLPPLLKKKHGFL